VLERLYVNKKYAAIYGQGLSGQKSTSCGEYYRKKSADFVSAASKVLQLKFIDDFFW
jgi:hypothetical protein